MYLHCLMKHYAAYPVYSNSNGRNVVAIVTDHRVRDDGTTDVNVLSGLNH